MAENMFKKYTESLVRVLEVGSNIAGGSPILIDTRPGVTLARSGGGSITKTTNLPGNITSITKTVEGVGYEDNTAAVAFDGTWLFAVTGVTDGATVPDSAAGTNQGTSVYITAGGVLTLTSSGNTYYGRIDDGYIVGGVAPVQIGIV